MEWKVKILEKGRVTIPQELKDLLGLKKGEEDVVERTKGVLKGVEPELTSEELEEAFLAAMASKIK